MSSLSTDSRLLPESALDTDDHESVIGRKVTIEAPLRRNPDVDGVIIHLLKRVEEYHFALRPTQWDATQNTAAVKIYLLYASVLMDSAVSALVLLALNDILLPTIIIQRSIAEYFVRATYYDSHPAVAQQAFDHYVSVSLKNLKKDQRIDQGDLNKTQRLYDEVKKRNPNLDDSDVPFYEMMKEVAGDETGFLYVLFYGVPSDIAHGLVGGFFRINEASQTDSSPAVFQANIRRTPDEVNHDLIFTARYVLHFADILAKRFATTTTIRRQWLEDRLLALEKKYEIA